MSDTFQPIIIASASSFNPSPGLNVSSDTAAATLQAEVAALGVSSVRATLTSAAEQATLVTLGTAGIKIDLVLAPGQSVSSFVSLAVQLNTTAPGAVISLEGPDLVADPGYSYVTSGGSTLSGDAAGDQATADLDRAAASAGLGSISTINYSSSVATTATGAANPTYANINPGAVALQEPDLATLTAAQDDATINANYNTTQYVVTNLGASSAGELLDAVLDAEYSVGFTQTATGSIIAPTTYLAAAAASGPVPLFTASGALTAAGTAYADLDAIIATGLSGTSAGGTLSLDVAQYQAGVQYADQVEVFAGPGTSDDIVWWGNSEAPNAAGHGPSSLQFGSVEATVTVYDPTQGTAAVASFSNISTLDVLDSPDGPLVVQLSNTVGTAGASSTGTYAGTVMASTTPTGVTTTTGSTGTTYTTAPSGMNTVAASGSGNVVVISQGTDTITAGAGTVTVFASGPAATVTGGTGNLTFVAGTGNDMTGGGSGVDVLYGGSGTDALFGSSGVNSILVAGSGNTSLIGGAGSQVVMFGGPGADTFFGSTGGSDTMVGGTGNNVFTTTPGDIVFGGPASADTYNLTGGEIAVEGGGTSTVNFDAGASTVFGGTGATTFNLLAGQGDNSAVIGFTAADQLTLVGTSSTAEAAALASAKTGSFGTMLNLADGTQIVLFGATLSAGQVSVG